MILFLILFSANVDTFNISRKQANLFSLGSKCNYFTNLPTDSNASLVTLIGATNVGKSSLFNRMTKMFQMGSLVSNASNTTRDPNIGVVEINGRTFRLIDTPGISDCDITERIIKDQVENMLYKAIEESTMSIMVVDGQTGLTNLDRRIAEKIRNHSKGRSYKCIIAVNKCESHQMGLIAAQEFWNLGLGEPIPCSALHGSGVAEVLEKCLENMPDLQDYIPCTNHISIALVGRPNTGKSSIANKLINKERFIVSPVAGTTVDSVDSYFTKNDKTYRIIDTCGITQNINSPELKLKSERGLLTIRQADLCILVIDSAFGISKTDLDLAKAISQESKPAIVVCNKWDLIDKSDATVYNKALNYVRDTLNDLHYANIIFISATSGQRINQLYDLIDEAIIQYNKQHPQKPLNEVIQDALFIRPPSFIKGKRFNVYYAAQIHTKPPGFVLFCNNNKLLTTDYEKYLHDTITKAFKISGTPIRIYKREKRLRNLVKDVRPANSYIFRPKNVEFGPC